MSDVSPAFDDPRGLMLGRSAALARNWWAILVRGIAAVVFGIIAFLLPGTAIFALVVVFGVYALVDGVFAIVAALRAAAHRERWSLLLAEGVLDILIGILALAWPGVLVLAAAWVIGAWALVTGGLLLAAAFRLHHGHGRWWMGLGGALSIVWGVLLALWPFAGAVVLTLWLGVYALLFGIAMIVFALRLRARHEATSYS